MYCTKTVKNYLKNLIQITMAIFLITLIAACSNNMQNEKSGQDTEQEGQMEKIGKKLDQEKAELEASLKQAIADFNNRIESYEKRLKETGESVNAKTEETIRNLKMERDTLAMKLDEVGDKTETNWEDFSQNVDQRTDEFKKAVKDFFAKDDQ